VSTPQVTAFSVGPLDNNVYILTCPTTGKRILIDPATEAQTILAHLGESKVEYILLTHGDTDHWLALDAVRAATGAPLGMHAADAPMITGQSEAVLETAERLGVPTAGLANPDRKPDFLLKDGDVVRFGDVALQVFHTPGHTAGGICFYSAPHLIDGDTLFPGGPGNTQRVGGDFPLIIDGIRTKLLPLPDETIVYPGHGKSTTIGAERPHLQEWVDQHN